MKSCTYKLTTALVCLVLASCGGTGAGRNEDGGRDGKNIVETGTLEAVRTRAFSVPRFTTYFGTMRIVGLVDHGAMVRAGDSLMQFDLSGVNKSILDYEASLENEMAAMGKLMVSADNTVKSLESSIRNEQASFNLKKIEVEATAFESERARRIKQLEFEQAKINLAQNERRLELAHIMNACDMKVQKIKVAQVESNIRNAERIKSQYTIRTDVSGVFQVGENYRTNPRTMLKLGDEVFMGQPLGNVPELERMKVSTYINENDFLKIRTGQKVAIRLDATPEITFDGEITYIGKLCHLRELGSTTSRQKVFDVEVDVLRSDERLKPGMTVSCEFLTGR